MSCLNHMCIQILFIRITEVQVISIHVFTFPRYDYIFKQLCAALYHPLFQLEGFSLAFFEEQV